ncbi:MAG TPA: valine--tRNA ligase [Polyangiaceae bacterium]|jgi:valyl-tRNA synthetase|nr:MAG: Valine--tRNA ligase [Deltaproteobacteria bacterium ADurb.Bin207]HNS96291.1 valine--tRNA ligase [Polyangiaceae bacterium]HNZ20701.1 valine--tRNA ligase [Polyangiaceae bacterium]HOD20683.1 valine--tRNA ligase [Polyangiaceae bacterium]HOE47102.1 valine--tRNA ligase [Polyangiaceae bacterium]
MNQNKMFRTIDAASLPKHFDAAEAEKRWDATWEKNDVHRYDPDRPRHETFAVDTPPPTVSGSLHIGHVFSYTHTDVIVRYQRMRGRNIFYPMGWDDNGLPTERRVQNYFNVRCDPHVPYEPGLTLTEATGKAAKDKPRIISRPNFIELCLQLTAEDEKAFTNLWRRIGLSVDWKEQYATIDDHCRTLAQLSFLDLFEKQHIYNHEAPTMWDVDFQTAVAQAEVEDRPTAGAFHDIVFGVEGSDDSLMISTTRPELLAACVGVTAHPDDARYRHLFGKRAITPVFHVPVPIFPSELADPQKGTGILMVCTFGDATDVLWWREQKLALRQIVGRDGRLMPVQFGVQGWESLHSDKANEAYAQLSGKSVKQAKAIMVELLRMPQCSAHGPECPLRGEPKPLQHAVKFFEKGDRPLEFVTTRQWFVRLMDQKEALLAKGDEVQWHPEFMRSRYRNWTENLQLDWCISRQRYFGVPFPVWYPLDEQGQPDYSKPIVAPRERLPVDPMSDTPPGHDPSQRDQPGGFTGESDVFDTWFTSSLTPQIGTHWQLAPARHEKLFPMDIRPQSHEIIRTWAFYSIAKALLHENKVPWNHVVISGWILDPDRKKMSKSKGNVVTPMHLLDEYTADGVRYWAANAKLGSDTAFDEKVLKVGRRLVTKLFNAGKFVLGQSASVHPIQCELDRAFVHTLRQMCSKATESFDAFEYAHALMATESFFWTHFTDAHIELVKARARGECSCDGVDDEAARGSAVASLRLGLSVLLRMFAPVVPFITEEVWSWVFAEETGHPSIHRAPWPTEAEFASIAPPEDASSFDVAVACWTAINKRKSEAGVSVARPAEILVLAAHPHTVTVLERVVQDVMAAAHCKNFRIEKDESLAEGMFDVLQAVFEEKKTDPS